MKKIIIIGDGFCFAYKDTLQVVKPVYIYIILDRHADIKNEVT